MNTEGTLALLTTYDIARAPVNRCNHLVLWCDVVCCDGMDEVLNAGCCSYASRLARVFGSLPS